MPDTPSSSKPSCEPLSRDAVADADTSGSGALPEAASLPDLVEALPGMVALLDASDAIVAASTQWKRALGRAGAFFDVIDDRDGRWRALLSSSRDENEPRRGVKQALRLHEEVVHRVDYEIRPWKGCDGYLLVSLTDRTSEHQSDVMRRQVESRFDVVIDTISEGILLMDHTGVFRDCNDVAERILGRPTSEIVGSKFSDEKWSGLREDGTPLPNAQFPFWQALVEREPIRDEVMGIYPPDEPPRWIRVNAQPLFRGSEEEPYGVLACFEDITDEQLKDEALQTSRDLLSSVLTSSLDGIMVFSTIRDDGGEIVDFECLLVNPQAEKMVNRSSEELVGTRMLDEMPGHKDNGLFDAYVHVVETGEPFENELHYQDDEFERWLQVVAVRIDEDGFAVTFRDISERKRAAQAMVSANAKLEQRNRALRDFAYIASHDLQEPLRKISAFSNLVLEDYGDVVDDTGRHYLERMQDAAQRMSQLISDLLVYSRVTTQARPFKPVDLTEIVRNVRSDLDMQIADVDGTVEVGELPTIEADGTQMRQLLQNLIGNALKFSRPDEPPVVRVEAATVELGDDGVPQVDADTDQICRLTVSDNGIGFEQKYADRIFTPFKRLHGRSEYEGTGMGLAICRRIVERHGGAISVESEPDVGTTFTIHLPIERGDASPEDSVSDHATTATTLDD